MRSRIRPLRMCRRGVYSVVVRRTRELLWRRVQVLLLMCGEWERVGANGCSRLLAFTDILILVSKVLKIWLKFKALWFVLVLWTFRILVNKMSIKHENFQSLNQSKNSSRNFFVGEFFSELKKTFLEKSFFFLGKKLLSR